MALKSSYSNLVDREVSSKDMTIADLNECANIFASQFDNSEIHDRVLSFQIIKDGKFETGVDSEYGEGETLSEPHQDETDKKNERDGNAYEMMTV